MYFAGDNVDTTTPLKLKWAFAYSKTHLLAGTGNCRSAPPFPSLPSSSAFEFEGAKVIYCAQCRSSRRRY